MGLRESRAAAMEDDNLSAAKPNPSQPTATPPSKSGPNDGNPEPETLDSQPPIGESSDPTKNDQESQEDGIAAAGENPPAGEGEEDDEEEKGECGFCLFMKGGDCREPFIGWEKCVEEGEKNKEDIVEKCFKETFALKKCMEAHTDYYGPLLVAEKEAEAEAIKELEAEKKEKEKAGEGNAEPESSKEKAEEGNDEPEGSKKKEES